MPSAVIKNFNSYATLAEATSYLDDSARALTWAALDTDSQARSLITASRLLDKQCLKGTKSTNLIVTAAVIAAGGTGYAVNDELTIAGGTAGEAAQIKVLTVASGVVTSLQILNAGSYTVVPTNPAATTGGTGTGCTLTLTSTTQTLQFGRDGITDMATLIPLLITYGVIELAFEISLDVTLEGSQSTASNIKIAQAGSAKVEFFRPGGAFGLAGASRFPTVVMEYIGSYLCGSGSSTMGGIASGTCDDSQFDDCDRSDVNQGLP